MEVLMVVLVVFAFGVAFRVVMECITEKANAVEKFNKSELMRRYFKQTRETKDDDDV